MLKYDRFQSRSRNSILRAEVVPGSGSIPGKQVHFSFIFPLVKRRKNQDKRDFNPEEALNRKLGCEVQWTD
jgi:hypothetical protein